MDDVTITDLESLWPASVDDPHPIFEGDDPPGQAGTYEIAPGERVPETGWTSHGGTEVSVILEGRLRLVTDESIEVGPGTVTVIPSGIEHYSENIGDEPARLVYAIFGEL